MNNLSYCSGMNSNKREELRARLLKQAKAAPKSLVELVLDFTEQEESLTKRVE